MKKVNVLIVHTIPVFRDLIKGDISDFNLNASTLYINIVGEANSFETANALIDESAYTGNKVQWVLLGYHLLGYRTGMDLYRSNPALRYIFFTDSISAIGEIELFKSECNYLLHLNLFSRKSFLTEIEKSGG